MMGQVRTMAIHYFKFLRHIIRYLLDEWSGNG